MKKSNGQLLKIQVRGGFADRNNVHPVNTTMQYENLDDRSRVALVNIINVLFHSIFDGMYGHEKQDAFWRSILFNVYSQQIDCTPGMSYRDDKMFEIINTSIYEDDYANVLSVVEYVARLLYDEAEKQYVIFKILNQTFEKEFVGYRFVNGRIVQITSEEEINQIEEAIAVKDNKVNDHLEKALLLLSDRENPDYENSIKESISAVEAMCNEIVGKKSTLGEALKQLKKENKIHPSLESAFEKLYGYTSDASGIRHAGQMDGKNSTFEEAKFMLVACSGFVNYLKGIYSKQRENNTTMED